MKTGKFFFSVLLILNCFSSCQKYLNEKPDKSLVVPTTIKDLQALLDDAYTMNLETTSTMPESSADDYFLTMDSYNSNNETARNTYTWSLTEYHFSNDWSYAYNAIYNTNLCLEGIAKIPRTTANSLKWDNVKGSALFYQSYYYLNLVWEFAKAYDESTADIDLGIVLRNGSDFNVKSVRASVEESYNKIISDAKESLAFLPDTSLLLLRPSKNAAYGLLARTYLSMRVYDSAFKYSNLSLKINDQLLDYNSVDPNNENPFPRLTNPETIFYTEMNGSNYLHATFQAFIDTLLYNSYDSNDIRKQAFFGNRTGYHYFKGNYAQDPYILFSGIARDEIVLIRAECYARQNNIDEAMHDLNTLLSMRWNNAFIFIPETASGKDEALDKILSERRKELLMRGLRWIDIKRLNKEGRNIILEHIIDGKIYSLQPNDNKYALPVPSDIIRITGIEQN